MSRLDVVWWLWCCLSGSSAGGWRGKAALHSNLGAHEDGNHPPVLLG